MEFPLGTTQTEPTNRLSPDEVFDRHPANILQGSTLSQAPITVHVQQTATRFTRVCKTNTGKV